MISINIMGLIYGNYFNLIGGIKMKKIIFVSLFSMFFVFSFNAYSAEGAWYVSGNIGMASLDDSEITDVPPDGQVFANEIGYDSGLFLAAAVGYDFDDFRIESEFSYQTNDIDEFSEEDITSLALLFNGYYDFLKGSKLRPYITGGTGLANVEVSSWGYSEDDTVFIYQAGAGIGYDMSENTTLDLRYRYLGTLSDPMDLEYSGHSVSLGVRYSF
jgi:opacity protein-like surface antigen